MFTYRYAQGFSELEEMGVVELYSLCCFVFIEAEARRFNSIWVDETPVSEKAKPSTVPLILLIIKGALFQVKIWTHIVQKDSKVSGCHYISDIVRLRRISEDIARVAVCVDIQKHG